MIIFPNEVGQTIPFAADDRFFLGEGLFETIRVENQRPCYAERHWRRMHQAALRLNILFELSQEAWHEQLSDCIDKANIHTGGVKVILTSGRAARGLITQGNQPRLLFEAFTYQLSFKPLRLLKASWLRDANNPIYQFKSVNYLESILARRQAVSRGADDVLFLNLQHHVTETTVANLFMIKNNQLLTPNLASGVLSGIIRNRLLDLCIQTGIACTEVALDSGAIGEADVLFVTNALQGIRVVKSLNDLTLPTKHPLLDECQFLLAQDKKRL